MKSRLLWGVGVLGALAAAVSCGSSSDTSKPPLDLTTCAKSSAQDDTCMACCGKAGFNGWGPGPDGACACAVVVIDEKACGKQPTADNCNACCAAASFVAGQEDLDMCTCIGASNDTVCSSSNTNRACSQCCADNMFLSGYVTNANRCSCTTS